VRFFRNLILGMALCLPMSANANKIERAFDDFTCGETIVGNLNFELTPIAEGDGSMVFRMADNYRLYGKVDQVAISTESDSMNLEAALFIFSDEKQGEKIWNKMIETYGTPSPAYVGTHFWRVGGKSFFFIFGDDNHYGLLMSCSEVPRGL
jgi:hypothetical protein